MITLLPYLTLTWEVFHHHNKNVILAEDIWLWCVEKSIWVTATFIPGKENKVAEVKDDDKEKAKGRDRSDRS